MKAKCRQQSEEDAHDQEPVKESAVDAQLPDTNKKESREEKDDADEEDWFASTDNHPVKNLLRRLACEDRDTLECAGLNNLKYFEELSDGLHIGVGSSEELVAVSNPKECHHGQITGDVVPEVVVQRCRAEMTQYGYFVLDSGAGDVRWGDRLLDLISRVSETMHRLKVAGWPPVFVFLYNEALEVLDVLYDIIAPFLPGGTPEHLELEASLFAWVLSQGQATGPKPGVVGTHERQEGGAVDALVCSNFPMPHRDETFTTCHTPDGLSTKNITVWVPVNDATLSNGCIYVLPKDVDEGYMDEGHPSHVNPSTIDKDGQLTLKFPIQHVRPLPAPAGSVIVWSGNLIHWGSSCRPNEAQPRRSIAMTFMAGRSTGFLSEKEIRHCVRCIGRAPLARTQLRDLWKSYVPYSKRVAIIARSLIMYSHWHENWIGAFALVERQFSGVDVDSTDNGWAATERMSHLWCELADSSCDNTDTESDTDDA